MEYTPPGRRLADLPISEIEAIFGRAVPEVFGLKEEIPVLSVLLPMYRAYNIGWIAFESLIRQEGVTFPWELLIIEENFNSPMGTEEILKYAPSLKEAGCCRIVYIPLDSWVPLSAKWYYLANSADQNSKVFALHAADNYSPAKRLAKQFSIMSKGEYTWYKLRRSVVYDLETNNHVQFYSTEVDRADTHSPAITSELFKKLPLDRVKMSVDGWMYRTLAHRGKIISYFDDSDMWKDAVNVNGLNLISHNRGALIQKVKPPLYPCCSDLKNHLSGELVERLQSYATEARNYRKVWEADTTSSKDTVSPLFIKGPKPKGEKKIRRRRNK